MNTKEKLKYFTPEEYALWLGSMGVIIAAYILFGSTSVLNFVSSLIGVTALIFCAKGNPIGQVLMVVFCVLYAVISWSFRYYGELITYVCMSMPMALIALVAWLKHPFEGKKSEVAVGVTTKKDWLWMSALTVVVTVIFYFVLRFFNTANLIPSTFSITTSFLAVLLTAKRSPYFALAYFFNDIVLIVLWALATRQNTEYISVIICFSMFLLHDGYGFMCWKRRQKQQLESNNTDNLP